MNMYKITNGDVVQRNTDGVVPLRVFCSCHSVTRCSRHVSPLRNCVSISTTFRLFARPRVCAARSGRGMREACNNNYIVIIALPIKISPDFKAGTRGFCRPTKRQRRVREQHFTQRDDNASFESAIKFRLEKNSKTVHVHVCDE